MYVALTVVGTSAEIALTVLGLGIILGVMDVINLAHTAFMAIGVYVALSLLGHHIPFYVAVPVAAAACGGIGCVAERLLLRRVYGKPLEAILATWGLSLVIIQVLTSLYGASPRAMATPVPGNIGIASTHYPIFELILVGLTAVVVTGMWAVQRFTVLGLKLRLAMSNADLAKAVGIDTAQTRTAAFGVGCMFAGLAGALLGPVSGISPNYESTLLVPVFLAVLMSGNTLAGLVAASAALAAVQVLFSYYVNPIYATTAVILAAVILLRVRPEGLVWRRA